MSLLLFVGVEEIRLSRCGACFEEKRICCVMILVSSCKNILKWGWVEKRERVGMGVCLFFFRFFMFLA